MPGSDRKKPVKAWGVQRGDGSLRKETHDYKREAEWVAETLGGTTKAIRVEIRVLHKRKKVSR